MLLRKENIATLFYADTLDVGAGFTCLRANSISFAYVSKFTQNTCSNS